MTDINDNSYSQTSTAIYTWLALIFALIPYFNPIFNQSSSPSSYPKPQLHFFAAPKPFTGRERESQLRALRSWLSLSSKPKITFFGNGTGIKQIAHTYGLYHQPRIDTTFLGIPIFPSLLSSISKVVSSYDNNCIAVFLNADIILFDDFVESLSKILASHPPGWLAVAARWDIDHLPSKASASYARELARLHTYGGIDLWSWDTAKGTLFDDFIPPFVLGRGKYDNWLTHEIITRGDRTVIDISHACTLVHERHDYHLVTRNGITDFEGHAVFSSHHDKSEYWSSAAQSKFELYINSYLATHYGSYQNQMGTIFDTPFLLMRCHNKDGLCLMRRRRPHKCRCEYSSFVEEAQNDPYILNDSRIIFCGMLSQNHGSDPKTEKHKWEISGRIRKRPSRYSRFEVDHAPKSFGLPLTLNHIITVLNNQTESNSIILAVGEFSERFLISKLVCSLKATEIFPRLVIAALDNDLYRYCLIRGMPVYLADGVRKHVSNAMNKKQYLRFQIVLELMKAGLNVLSIQPNCVFSKQPWDYIQNEVGDAQFGLLPPNSFTTLTNREIVIGNTSKISSTVVYAAATQKSILVVQEIVNKLRKKNPLVEIYLRSLACTNKLRIQEKKCKSTISTVHLFDREIFKPIENDYCPECIRSSEPVLYYVNQYNHGKVLRDTFKNFDNASIGKTDPLLGICDYS